MARGKHSSPVRLEIAWKTIIKILLGVLLAFVAIKLWPLFKLLVVSILLAVPLYRLVLWIGSKGWPRWAGVLLASLALIAVIVGLVALAGPIAIKHASNFGKDFPRLKQQFLSHVSSGPLHQAAQRASSFGSDNEIQQLSQKALTAAKATATGLLDLVLVIALTIYLMVDGMRALQWLIAYFPRERRFRVSKGLEKIGNRIVAYVAGQSIVSGLFATFACLVLSLLHVPMAVLLALLAGVLDVIPVVGISVSLVLAGLAALTVSSTTALIVLGLYCAYHVLENYFIIPKVYGKKLRLSTLAVILSMITGGMLAGVVGAVAALPLAAAYPALESLWLSRQIEPEVVRDHQEQLRAA